MSGISATDFSEGPELFDQEKFWSKVYSSIEPNPQTIDAEFAKPLSERISGPINTSGIYADYRLDDVIVRVPSDAFRRHEINQWNHAKKDAEDKKWAWNATALGSLAVAGIGGLGMGEMLGTFMAASPLSPALIVAGLVVGVVAVIFSISSNNAAAKAVDQINQWNGAPVMKIGQERNYAHDQGFTYIYSHNLKLGREPSHTARFHFKQVEHEYKKHFDAFCKKMLGESCSSCKVSWMENFSSMNPLSSKLMIYGLGEVPERMTQVIADYERLESFLRDIRSSYGDLKTRENQIANDRIKLFNLERTDKLKPYTDARSTALAAARATRDAVFAQYPLETSRHHQDAKRNYEAIKKALDEDYDLRAAPINKTYDRQIQEVEKDRDVRVQRLDNQKYHQLANNYNAARDLLVRAERAWKGDQYQPVNFQQYFPWQAAPVQPVYYAQHPAAMNYYPPQQPVYPQTTAPVYPPVNTGYIQPGYPQNGYIPPYNPVYYPATQPA